MLLVHPARCDGLGLRMITMNAATHAMPVGSAVRLLPTTSDVDMSRVANTAVEIAAHKVTAGNPSCSHPCERVRRRSSHSGSRTSVENAAPHSVPTNASIERGGAAPSVCIMSVPIVKA